MILRCDVPAVLDGGMGRQLERVGAPFRQPEWSALALMEAPETVGAAHRAFVAAGAGLVTTNSYALVPFHIGEARFERDGARLAALAGRLAREAAGAGVLVAGSLPPLFGSYRPDLFDAARAPGMLAVLVPALAPFVDLFLAETMGCTAEALAALAAVRPTGKACWVSFTLAPTGPPRLRSGEAVGPSVVAVRAAGAAAVLFNCAPPEAIGPALAAARAVLGPDVALGAYANAFPEDDGAAANEGISALRLELTPGRYADWAAEWRRLGADMVGGCCGIGPEHIAALGRRAGKERA